MGFRLGKWVSWFLLVLAAVALLIPWLASLQARPIEEHFEQDALTLTLALSSDRVFLPSECVTARWQVEGIREVYFNGEGVIGEGQRVICPANGPVSLRVLQMDGTEKTLVANAQVTSISLVSFALYGLALIAVILVCRNGSLPLLNRFWRSCARIVARVPARIVNLGHWLQAHPLVVIPIITLLGAALRFSGVGHRSLILDEAVIELIATGSIGDVIRQNAHMNSAPPLFALAINQVLVLGHTELLLRAIPLFASILVIPAFYVLAKRFVTRGAAYLATLVIATALVPVYYAQYTREYSLTLLLSILALLCFLNYRAHPSRRHLLALGACWVAAILTQYGLALLILPLNLWLLWEAARNWWTAEGRERQRIVVWMALLQGALVLAVGAVLILSLRDQLRAGSFAGDSYLRGTYWDQIPASLPSFLIVNSLSIARAAYSEAIFGQNWDIAVLLMLTGFGALAVLLAKRQTQPALLRTLLLATYGITMLFGLLRLYPYGGGRQTMMLSVFVFLLLAVAFSLLLRLSKERAVAAVTVLAVAGIVGANLQNYMKYSVHPGFDDATPVVTDIANRWQDGDRLVLVNYAQALFAHYFIPRFPERRASIIEVDDDPDHYGPVVNELSKDPGRIWVVLTNSGDRFAAFAAEQPWANRVSPQMTWTNVSSFLIVP